jgi:hypothetical protein
VMRQQRPCNPRKYCENNRQYSKSHIGITPLRRIIRLPERNVPQESGYTTAAPCSRHFPQFTECKTACQGLASPSRFRRTFKPKLNVYMQETIPSSP